MPKPKAKIEFKNPKLRRIVFLGETIQTRGEVQEIIRKNWREIVYDIGVGLSASEIALKYGIGRRSLFNFLKLIGTSIEEIRKLVKQEEEMKKKTELEKIELKMIRLKVVPKTPEEFEKLVDWALTVKADLSKSTYSKYMKVWLELCQFTGKNPKDITKDDVVEFVTYKKLEWSEKGKNMEDQVVKSAFSSSIKSPLRVFCSQQGIPIDRALKTVEYESPYRKVRINVVQRFKILEWIYEHYPNDFLWVKAVLYGLYYNAHRDKELPTIAFEPQDGIVYVYTLGKRGIRYTKYLRKDVYEIVRGYLPIGNGRIRRLKKILREAYENILKPGTVTYKYAMERPLHVWRHTACNDLIDFTGYNIAIIMELLGWKNPSMITKVYGKASSDMIAQVMGWKYALRKPFEFLYNVYAVERKGNKYIVKKDRALLDEAYLRGWITKEHYEEVKRIQNDLIREFKAKVGNVEVIEG